MRKFFVAVFIFCLFSCDREVTVEPIPVKQELVVNGLVESNGIDSLLLTRTFNVEGNIKVEGADIVVLNENDTIGSYHEKGKGVYYYYGENFQEQESYILNIKHSNFSGVCAETAMPVVPKIWAEIDPENGERIVVEDNAWDIDFQILLAFEDDEQLDNYYSVSAESYSEYLYEYIDYSDNMDKDSLVTKKLPARLNSRSPFVEIIRYGDVLKFVQNNIDWEGSYAPYQNEIIFSDKFFNGEKIVLPIDLKMSTMLPDTKVVYITLTAISNEYYQLLRSLAAINKNRDGFFPEVIELYSNISNGKGVWAAKSSKTIAIQVDGQRIYNEKYN